MDKNTNERKRATRLAAAAAMAAAMSTLGLAASANAAEITLYEHANFAGTQVILRGWTPDIGRVGFGDRASSVVVGSGRWELCSDADFKGFCQTFVRGEYPTLDARLNNRISSAREIGSYGENRGSYYDYGRGAIELFDQPGFAGTSLQLAGDAPTLRRSGFNDRAASAIVTQGTWELCADDEFAGACRTYAPGRYPDLGFGMARQVSSARLLHVANEAPVVLSGGNPPPSGPPGRIVLYNERGLRGSSLTLSGPIGELERSNFNDATMSIYVESGSWLACRDSFFRGECRVFGPGRYDDLAAIGFDHAISSIRPGGEAAAPPPPPPLPATPPPPVSALEFFSEPDFAGERLAVDGEIRDLDRAGFNDRAASVVVRSGTWELCTDARFGGSCAVFRPGSYPRMGGLTRQVSSVRRIQ